jgi:hypothetical protein
MILGFMSLNHRFWNVALEYSMADAESEIDRLLAREPYGPSTRKGKSQSDIHGLILKKDLSHQTF